MCSKGAMQSVKKSKLSAAAAEETHIISNPNENVIDVECEIFREIFAIYLTGKSNENTACMDF